jgi:FkbM family methyltransferase
MPIGVWKPWYVYRPQQILRRLIGLAGTPSSDYQHLRAAWGIDILANPAEHLGRCLWTTGIYDLAVSEVMFRLVRRGDIVLDAGANIGYMTLLAAVAAGPQGRVISWEPNPHLFSILTKNVNGTRARIQMAPVDLRQTALGAYHHRTVLVLSDPAVANNGLSYIPIVPSVVASGIPPSPSDGEVSPRPHTVEVEVETLDDLLGGQTVGLAKLDVEGYEIQVFTGSTRALDSHRIRHIVFEDHQGTGSAAAALLEASGYRLFSIGWSMTRPLLAEVRPGRSLSTVYEAPSYLATVDPEHALRACARSGWRALRRQTVPHVEWQ